MKAALVAFFLAAACGHGDSALRDEQSRSRHYRDAYETQAQEIVQDHPHQSFVRLPAQTFENGQYITVNAKTLQSAPNLLKVGT